MNGYMRSRPVIRVIEISSKRGTSAPDECEDCSRTSRRSFLGQVSGVAFAAALASELGIPDAAALSVGETSGAQTHPDVRTYPLPAADGATIDRDAQVILVRYQNRVFAFALACPHENTALRWRQQDGRFQCPRHQSKYQPDGTFISGRATRNMDRFAVRREGESIVVDLNQWFRSDQQSAQWTAAVVAL
jgi:nitrite reductase/ring-hydroxylating ferredoxin subunit